MRWPVTPACLGRPYLWPPRAPPPPGSRPLLTRHGLDEPIAFAVEAALIDACTGLMNQVNGHGHEHGAMHGREIIRVYAAETAVPARPEAGHREPHQVHLALRRSLPVKGRSRVRICASSRGIGPASGAGAAWVHVVLGDLDAYPHTPRICPVSRPRAPDHLADHNRPFGVECRGQVHHRYVAPNR
jgi:hypothetical protein